MLKNFLTFNFLTDLFILQRVIKIRYMQEISKKDNIITFDQHNYNTFVENNDNKNREFGKDITNAFICARKSLDQNNSKICKQTKLGDFKNFQLINKEVKKTQTTNLVQNKFGLAPRQTQGINTKKSILKKQNSFILGDTQNNTKMDIDSCNLKADDSIALTEPNFVSQTSYAPQMSEQNLFTSQSTIKANENMKDLLLIDRTKAFDTQESNLINLNIQEVPEYSHSIFLHLKESEINHPEFYPQANYMKFQNDINDKMRAILFDWLIDVHLKFKLLPETLYLTLNLIDRYLNKRIIPRSKLQLVGVSAMLIACKYEEIYAPEIKDFVYITDRAYTSDEVKKMEIDILAILEFNVTMPSAFRFAEFFSFFITYNALVWNFTLYLLELSIVEYRMLKYKVSLIAAATIYVSSKLLHKENICYNESIEFDLEKLYDLSGYTEDEIKECAKDVCLIYDNSEKSGLCAIKKKFSLPKFDQVSKIRFGK